MTKRRVRRKVRTPAKPVVNVEEDLAEQELAEEEEAEEEAPKPAAKRKRRTRRTKPEPEVEVEEKPKPTRRRRKAKPAPEPEPEVEEEELEEEEAPAPKSRRRRHKAKPAPEPEPFDNEETGEEEYLADDVEFSVTTTGNDLADALIAACDAGKTVVIQKVRNKYNISTASGVPAVVVAETTPSGRPKYALTKKVLDDVGQTQDYKDFMPAWRKMTWEEKLDKAEDEGVDVDKILATYDDALVLNINLTAAIHKKLGIVKWEDGFTTSTQRKQIRITGVLPD